MSTSNISKTNKNIQIINKTKSKIFLTNPLINRLKRFPNPNSNSKTQVDKASNAKWPPHDTLYEYHAVAILMI